jgi:hypothetical protein
VGILSMPVGPHAIFTNTNAMQEGFQYEAWIKKRATTGRARSSRCKGKWALSSASQTLALGHLELIHGQATRSMQTSKALQLAHKIRGSLCRRGAAQKGCHLCC